MDLEGTYRRTLTVGPKKYVCTKDNLVPPRRYGDYEFCANGVRAGEVTKTDVLAEFEKVLKGEQIQFDHS